MSDAADADLPHENGARKWASRHSILGAPYQAFRTLAEARTRPDALVVLDLDAEPFEPLATFPARRVEADEGALRRLHADLGAIVACVDGPAPQSVEGAVQYEAGGVFGRELESRWLDGLVLHGSLRGLGLGPEVEAVFLGVHAALDPESPRILAARSWWEAVDRGDLDAVRDLIGRGVPIEQARRGGPWALTTAVQNHDVAMVRLLLARGADPNRPDMGYRTPMISAAVLASHLGNGYDDEVLRLLMAAGGRLGFRESVVLGDVDLARRCLDADPTIDVSGDARVCYEHPFLVVAAMFGRLDMVRFLLDRGADVDGDDHEFPMTALDAAASRGRLDIVSLLLERGANPDPARGATITPLVSAARGGHEDVVRLLLDRGVRRTLIDAVFLDDRALVAELLATGDSDIRDAFWECEDHLACRGDVRILRMLLHAASGRWEDWVVPDLSWLLKKAADVGCVEVVRLMLEFGFDPRKPDGDGAMPAEHAERAGHAEVAELLRAAAAAARSFTPDDSEPFRRGRG